MKGTGKLFLMGLFVAGSLSFTACGDDAKDEKPAADTTATAAPAPQEAPAASAATPTPSTPSEGNNNASTATTEK